MPKEQTGKEDKVQGIMPWVDKSVKVNPLNNAVNMFFLAGIYYVIEGTMATHGTVLTNVGFLLFYITYSTILIPSDAVRNARAAFVKGKWMVNAGEVAVPVPALPNAFRYHVTDGLMVGPAATVVGVVVLLLVGNSALLPFISIGYAYAIVTILSGWIMKRHLATDLARIAAHKGGDAFPRPFKDYYLKEFVAPWTIALVVVNFAFTLKGNVEIAIRYAPSLGGGVLAPVDFEFMALTTSFFIMLWTGLLSLQQVPTDVKLGRIKYPAPRSPREAMKNLVVILAVICGISLACWLVTMLVLDALGIVVVPVIAFVVGNLAIGIPSGLVGLRLGMPFGMALDTLDILKQKKGRA